MPRKSRIDAENSVHHVICRGIERGVIFRDDTDRINFTCRFAALLRETGTLCYAWALIPNHLHLLLKTGTVPLAQLMRRLLTGYAISFNRRHHRSGHLFQNRYKSILCEEDAYLLELVRYIHLNPLRACLVPTFNDLDTFSHCGHAGILGTRETGWQDTEGVLKHFGSSVTSARRAYREFVEKGADQGRRSDLTGGGLIRSAGGWINVAALRSAGPFQKSDERILGCGDFVEKVLSEADERMERKSRLRAHGFELQGVAECVCRMLNVDKSHVFAPGKERSRVAARSLLCYWAVRGLGMSERELSHILKISPSAITRSVKRGEELAGKNAYPLRLPEMEPPV